MPPLTWKALGSAAVTGILIVFAVWWMGPAVFEADAADERQVVPATVIEPMDCTNPDAEEKIRFRLDGDLRTGLLSACGHDQDEQVRIAVPSEPGEPDGDAMKIHLAATDPGIGNVRRPVGMLLLVLSCTSGALYAFLVVRGPRREVAMA